MVQTLRVCSLKFNYETRRVSSLTRTQCGFHPCVARISSVADRFHPPLADFMQFIGLQTDKLQSLVPLPFFAPFQKAAAKTHKPIRSPTEPAGAVFVYFYQRRKIFKIFCENPLTILAFCDKIVNCVIIAFTMGISAFRQGPRSKKGDFTRFSLCNLTNTKGERSIRLRPRHLPCPWVVRLTHEVPDVRADVF